MAPLSLQSIHHSERRGSEEWESPLQLPGADGMDVKSAISGMELAVRVLYMGDRHLPPRMDWLRRVTSSFDHHLISEDVELFLGQAESYFDAVVVHGADTRRIRQIVRRINKILPGKLLFCLVDENRPKAVADLLDRGADDVFYLEMHPDEARARMRAAYRRRQAGTRPEGMAENCAMPIVDELLVRRVEADVQRAPLRRMGRIVLQALLSNADHAMSYEQLYRVIGHEALGEPTQATRNLLAVTMSHIRASLPDYLCIINEPKVGYSLRFKRPEAWPERGP